MRRGAKGWAFFTAKAATVLVLAFGMDWLFPVSSMAHPNVVLAFELVPVSLLLLWEG